MMLVTSSIVRPPWAGEAPALKLAAKACGTVPCVSSSLRATKGLAPPAAGTVMTVPAAANVS